MQKTNMKRRHSHESRFGLIVCLVQGGEDVRDEEALSGAHAEHRPHVFPLLRMRTKKCEILMGQCGEIQT